LISDTLNAVFLDTLNTSNIFDLSFDAYFYDIYTSTSKLEKSDDFSLFPNPANSTLFLRSNKYFGSNLNYQIINIEGQIVGEGKLAEGNKEAAIGIQSIPPSVYLLRLRNSKEVIKQLRFIKMRE